LITRRPYTRFFARSKGDKAQTLSLRNTPSGIEFEMYQL